MKCEKQDVFNKTLDDQIEVGDIVQDRNGRLMKRTYWGWDLCANSLK
jgi:hypothetical protein